MEQHNLGTFGQRLHALLQERGGTPKFMAEYLGCTTSNYQKMKYGQVDVSAMPLIALAEHFHVNTDYLPGLRDKR